MLLSSCLKSSLTTAAGSKGLYTAAAAVHKLAVNASTTATAAANKELYTGVAVDQSWNITTAAAATSTRLYSGAAAAPELTDTA